MANLYGSNAHPIIEMLIDGTWTDVSARVRNAQRVQIDRGRSNEQSRISAQRASFTVENTDAYFSTRTPSSVNYRKIGKNTQVRIRAGNGDNHLVVPYNDTGNLTGAQTADKASLDIAGDIDIRVDMWPHSWRSTRGMTLMAKWTTIGNQRSYALRINQTGQLILNWSPDGTNGNAFGVTSTPVPVPTGGRLAVRATLDVDNGGGGRTVTFYTAPTIAGPWTTLGSPSVAGVTSIYSSTADLAIGRGTTLAAPFQTSGAFGGKLYRLQVYSGIAGTLVADFNPSARNVGDTSWSDGLAAPNTWTVSGTGSRVTSDRVRFWGEIASLPKEWDSTSRDSIVPVKAAGMFQRLSQGVKPIESAMMRNFRGLNDTFGWWPLEDESTATAAANLAPGTAPLATIYPGKVTDVAFGNTDSPPGATRSMAFRSSASRFSGRMNLREMVAPATYSFTFYIRVDSLPAASRTFCSIDMFGQLARVDIALSGSGWDIIFFNILGQQIASNSTAIGLINPANGWIGYNLILSDAGPDVVYEQKWDTIGTFGGGTGPDIISGYSLNPPTQIRFTAAADAIFNNARFSHIFVTQDESFDLSNNRYRDASNAYRGETAAARLVRLSAEEGVPMEIIGSLEASEPMGYQTIKSYPDLISECWDVDGGIGGEARDALTLQYRVRADMESRQDLLVTHSTNDLSEPPRPVDDDQGFTNDVTVVRNGGSAWRAVVTEGYTSISDPPAGVGRYNSEVTLNIATDDRLPAVAGWLALTGSWDQDRYPLIAMALHRARVLADDALFAGTVALRLGDTVTLAGLPSWMPPDQVAQTVQGYTEQLSRFLWEIGYNCSPAGPYQAVPQLGHDGFVPRLDATTHTHSNSLTTTGTSLTLVTPPGRARWADSATFAADFPMDIVVNGEVMRLTAVTGTTSPQTGTVVRSINGVVKSHTAGSLVRIANPYYIGR